MVDMVIIFIYFFFNYWNLVVNVFKLKWMVVDVNWVEYDIQIWIQVGYKYNVKIVFELVLVVKVVRLFFKLKNYYKKLELGFFFCLSVYFFIFN